MFHISKKSFYFLIVCILFLTHCSSQNLASPATPVTGNQSPEEPNLIKYDPSVIITAFEDATLTKEEAALSIWAAFMGDVKNISENIREKAKFESDKETFSEKDSDFIPHLFMAKAISEMNEFSIETQEKLRNYLKVDLFKDIRNSSKNNFSKFSMEIESYTDLNCEWLTNHPHITLLVQRLSGPSEPSVPACSQVTDILPSTLTKIDAVISAAITSYDHFRAELNHNTPLHINIELGEFAWSDSLAGYASPDSTSNDCYVKIDSAGGEEEIKGTTVHEMLHCYQYASGWDVVQYATEKWAWEGSAESSIQDVFPENNFEHSSLEGYFTPKPLGDRRYDAALPFYHFLTNGLRNEFYDFIKEAAASDDKLTIFANVFDSMGDFSDRFHALSVLSYNWDPVPQYVNDGLPITTSILNTVLGTTLVANSPDITLPQMTLEALDYNAHSFFLESDVDMVEITELPTDPNLQITIILDAMVSGGVSEVIDLSPGETEYLFCRQAVGICHDTPDNQLRLVDRITLIFTNVNPAMENQIVIQDVKINTMAPQLHGNWYIYNTLSGQLIYKLNILETTPNDRFAESIFAYTWEAYDMECERNYASIMGDIDSVYDTVNENSASGILNIPPIGLTSTTSPPMGTCTGASPYNPAVEISLTLNVMDRITMVGNELLPVNNSWATFEIDGDHLTICNGAGCLDLVRE